MPKITMLFGRVGAGIQQQVIPDRIEILGEEHPDTLLASDNLVGLYQTAERWHDAIAAAELLVAKRAEVFGFNHPDTRKIHNTLELTRLRHG